jgi:hypothetical protein
MDHLKAKWYRDYMNEAVLLTVDHFENDVTFVGHPESIEERDGQPWNQKVPTIKDLHVVKY